MLDCSCLLLKLNSAKTRGSNRTESGQFHKASRAENRFGGGGAVGRGADLGGIVIQGVKAEARFDKTGTSVPFHLQPLQR